MAEAGERRAAKGKAASAAAERAEREEEEQEERPRTAPEVTMTAAEIDRLRDRLRRKFH